MVTCWSPDHESSHTARDTVRFATAMAVATCRSRRGNTMPTRSKAAILVEPNAPLVIDDVTFPDPQPDQVLVKLFASGICHSQLHQIHRTPQTAHRGTPAIYPSLLGHEATGVVVAKGHQVTHVQEGDHVMTTWVDRGAVEGAPPRAPCTC